MAELSGFLTAVESKLDQKCSEVCRLLFEKFANDDLLKNFRKTLDENSANTLRRLIDVHKFDVNQKVQYKNGEYVYTCTPLSIAILYSAFTNKNTTMCVQVMSVMRIQTHCSPTIRVSPADCLHSRILTIA
jgi:hypothetical protein